MVVHRLDKLVEENTTLQSSLTSIKKQLCETREELSISTKNYDEKIDRMSKQLQLHNETNINLEKRLNESQLTINEITEQRNELYQRCTTLSNKFIQYKNTTDIFFKVSDLTNKFIK